MKNMNLSKLYTCLMACVLLTSPLACSDHGDEPIPDASIRQINELVDAGKSLLKEVVSTDAGYTLHFNNAEIEIGKASVQSIETDRDRWTTLLTLTDHSTIEIPTLGHSLEALVEEINVNPSGYNPLAVTLHLNTPCGGAFRAGVTPKAGSVTPKQETTYGYNPQLKHFITVLGLYADYNNQIELTLIDDEGQELITSTIEAKTPALNLRHLPEIKVTKALAGKMEPGMNLVACPGQGEGDLSIPFMTDADGEVRWILDWSSHPHMQHFGAQCGAHPMANGHYVLADWNEQRIVEADPLGNIVHKWDLNALGYDFHHEIREGTNGNFLIAVTRKDATLKDRVTHRIFDHIIEFNPLQGNVVKEWDMGNVLDMQRLCFLDDVGFGKQWDGNWLHNNGVTEYGTDHLLITARWQGVVKFRRDNGKVSWIVAPHKGWGNAWQNLLLQPLDKDGQPITDPDVINGLKPHPDFEWPWGVHCPVVLPDGHIVVFDNGCNREFIPKLENREDVYSRAVEYEIDERNMTVRQVWQYGKERGREGYAAAISGVDYLPQTNHRLFCPGMMNRLADGKTGGRVVEIDPATGEVVFEMEMAASGNGAFHRVSRLPLYPVTK